MQPRSIDKKWPFALVLVVASAGAVIADKGVPTKGGGGDAGDEFAEINGKRLVVNECNGSFKVEVDATSFQLGYLDFASDLPSFTWDEAKHDIIESCWAAVHRMAPLCVAQRSGGDPDEDPAVQAVKKKVKLIRCSFNDAKASQAPKSSFADGTWSVAYTWWTTNAELAGTELAVAKGLQLQSPAVDTAKDDTPIRAICHAQKECKSGFTCAASSAHGPRCLSKADLAPPPEEGGGDGDVSPSGPTSNLDKASCTFKGHKLYGNIKIVTGGADLTVTEVSTFPDLKVKKVLASPNKCGEWKIVTGGANTKVKFVSGRADVKIKYVPTFPGM